GTDTQTGAQPADPPRVVDRDRRAVAALDPCGRREREAMRAGGRQRGRTAADELTVLERRRRTTLAAPASARPRHRAGQAGHLPALVDGRAQLSRPAADALVEGHRRAAGEL